MTFSIPLREVLESKVNSINQKRHKCKPRLYIGYFARPSNPMHPHQALLVGPEYTAKRMPRRSYLKFHIYISANASKGKLVPSWIYECDTIDDIHSENRLVALVCLGKIRIPVEELKEVLGEVPIYQPNDPNPIEEKAKRFKDTTWVASGFNMLGNKGYISSAATLVSMEEIECKSQAFTQAYGHWSLGAGNEGGIPVLDLMSSKLEKCERSFPMSRLH